MTEISENWEKIKENVRTEHHLSQISYDVWVKSLEYYKTENNTVYIIIPSDQTQHLSYIKSKFTDCFKVQISEMIGKSIEVDFVLKRDVTDEPAKTQEIKPAAEPANQNNNDNLNPKYKFETFIVGKNNNLAHSACLAVAETPGEVYNPLYIYGGPGLGKTHLMHSIGHFILEQDPNKKVLYVTSEEFTNEVIQSVRSGNATSMAKLREKYRTVDVLMVDDIQFIIGKDATQEEFFHTFNALHEAGKQIVLSSDKPPKEIQTLDERFKSRFSWGLTVDIQAPDYETRVAILQKNAEYQNISISDDITEYIATNIKSNIREIEGALNKIVALSKLKNTVPSMELAQEALKDIISPNKQAAPSPEIIIATVADFYNIKPEDITSQSRKQEFVLPRQIVMYLCSKILYIPYQKIAQIINKKDHTTVLHGVKKVEQEIKVNESLSQTVEEIVKKITS